MSEWRLMESQDLIETTEIMISSPPDLSDLIVEGISHLAVDGSDPFHALGVLLNGSVHLFAVMTLLRRQQRCFGIL